MMNVSPRSKRIGFLITQIQFGKELSIDERTELDNWKDESPTNQKLYEELTDTKQHVDVNEILEKLKFDIKNIKAHVPIKDLTLGMKISNWVNHLLRMKVKLILLFFLISCNTLKTTVRIDPNNGNVKFINMPTRQVLKALENRYNLKVTYRTKKVSKCTFTGVFHDDTNLDYFLKFIQHECDGLHLKFDSVNKEIVVF